MCMHIRAITVSCLKLKYCVVVSSYLMRNEDRAAKRQPTQGQVGEPFKGGRRGNLMINWTGIEFLSSCFSKIIIFFPNFF